MQELNGDEGTVFMWSPHENTILNAIARQLTEDNNPPDDRELLLHFLRRMTKGGDRAMVDLCDLAGKAYFHPDTLGSSSIKKVLPAILKGSDELKAKYSRPVYGAPSGMPSLNFSSPQGFAWIDVSADGTVSDPYGRLKAMARDMLTDFLSGLLLFLRAQPPEPIPRQAVLPDQNQKLLQTMVAVCHRQNASRSDRLARGDRTRIAQSTRSRRVRIWIGKVSKKRSYRWAQSMSLTADIMAT